MWAVLVYNYKAEKKGKKTTLCLASFHSDVLAITWKWPNIETSKKQPHVSYQSLSTHSSSVQPPPIIRDHHLIIRIGSSSFCCIVTFCSLCCLVQLVNGFLLLISDSRSKTLCIPAPVFSLFKVLTYVRKNSVACCWGNNIWPLSL